MPVENMKVAIRVLPREQGTESFNLCEDTGFPWLALGSVQRLTDAACQTQRQLAVYTETSGQRENAKHNLPSTL
jgi:hypothetical protein